MIINNSIIFLGKFISLISKSLNIGHGSTWPGHIALTFNSHVIKDVINNNPQLKVVLIAGTNGKTTTGRMFTTILDSAGYRVFQNKSGANLLNGIASSIVLGSSVGLKLPYDYAIFEVDENALPLILDQIKTPQAIVCLNLFRDQLDRYGELDSIAKEWKKSFQGLSYKTSLILNADDPLIAFLGNSLDQKIMYFGLSKGKAKNSKLQHASDSIYCPRCSHKLIYEKFFYSHLGVWRCPSCGLKRKQALENSFLSPLPGLYNEYNTQAAVTVAQALGIPNEKIKAGLQAVSPAFGRQEKFVIKGKNIQIFLSKNPASFNQSLETIRNLGAKTVLFVLNDRIPDGTDVSWIWDIDIEYYVDKFKYIFVSGDRTYDMALRIKYSMKFPISNFQFQKNDSNSKLQIHENLNNAISSALGNLSKNETLYILPTYSAMLEVRKILTGRRIL